MVTLTWIGDNEAAPHTQAFEVKPSTRGSGAGGIFASLTLNGGPPVVTVAPLAAVTATGTLLYYGSSSTELTWVVDGAVASCVTAPSPQAWPGSKSTPTLSIAAPPTRGFHALGVGVVTGGSCAGGDQTVTAWTAVGLMVVE
jgi:hypothetical protein